MHTDVSGIIDEIMSKAEYLRDPSDEVGLHGFGVAVLLGPDGLPKQAVPFRNLVTQVGDQYWGERAAGIASPPAQVTGMQLGTGSTAVAKTGAGAAIVTLVASSLVALDATYPQSGIPSSARRIQWRTTWAAGVATANGINEVALVNQSTGTQTAAPAANTIARALFSPVINKTALDSLVVTWNTDLLGA